MKQIQFRLNDKNLNCLLIGRIYGYEMLTDVLLLQKKKSSRGRAEMNVFKSHCSVAGDTME